MKTREEIEQEYRLRVKTNFGTWLEVHTHNKEWRDAALAELDDPMARLIAAGRRAVDSHIDSTGTCGWCDIYAELRDAINYAEQRRAQG